MKKKLVSLTLGMGCLVFTLSGCGATTESLVGGMFENGLESFTANAEFDGKACIGMDGYSTDVDLDFEFLFKLGAEEKDARTLYMALDSNLDMMDEEESFYGESYFVRDDDEVIVYDYDSDYGNDWYYEEQDADDIEIDADDIEAIVDLLKDFLMDAELAEDTERENGEECYVLTYEPSGKQLFSFIEELGEIIDNDDVNYAIDKYEELLKNMQTNITVYVSKKTGKMVSMSIDFGDTDFEELFEEVGEINGYEISDCECKTIIITITDVNDTEVEVPDSVIDGAEEW